MYTVGLYTLGCKVSQYETEAIAEGFEAKGFCVLPFEEVCDAYVINTCTVTRESDRKSRQMIRRAIKRSPGAVVAAVGCYTQRSADEVASIEGVDVVIGTDGKMAVIDRVIEALENRDAPCHVSTTDVMKSSFEPMRITRAPRTRAYVKIEDGCEARCSYCAISDARGRVRSKPPSDVVEEVEYLSSTGIREIVLTGIEIGSYGKDLSGVTLADLLVLLDERRSAERIRLGSLAPELVGRDFAERIKGIKILAPHFHISMQSGSDRVLRGMRRRYSLEGAVANIERLREIFPGAMFTTDLMVGFPGESEEDFLMSCEFVRRVGLLDAHVFAYSRRKDTPADTYPDQVDEAVKRERSERLIRVVHEVRDGVLGGVVAKGDILDAIAEDMTDGHYTAHTDTYVECRFRSPEGATLTGEAVRLKPISHKDGVVLCELVDQNL